MMRDPELPTFLRSTILIVICLLTILFFVYVLNSLISLGTLAFTPVISLEVENIRNIVAAASRVATLLLAMLISGMAIAVPLAANNFTPRLIKMFTKDITNRFIFGLLLCFGAITMWLCFVAHSKFFFKFYLYLCFFLFIISLSAIVPYLFHMFSFLNPNSLIFRLRVSAQNRINSAVSCQKNKKNLIHLKHEIVEYMDSIANIALKALERNDRQSFSAAMLNIQILSVHYCKLKPFLPKEWHQLDVMEVGMFMGILTPARDEIQKQKVTLELHICQFLLEFFECVSSRTRDAADPVAFTIYKISTHYVFNHDKNAIEMYMALFNSALRLGINISSIRMVYNISSHYRNLAVDAMCTLPDISLKIAKKMLYYAELAIDRKKRLYFVAEVMAYELRKMIELGLEKNVNNKNIDRVIEILLKLPFKAPENTLLGVIKARLALSAVLVRFEKNENVEELQAPALTLNAKELNRVYRDLLEENPLLYWEITPRQMNLDYVEPQDRNYIYDFINKIKNENDAELIETGEEVEG